MMLTLTVTLYYNDAYARDRIIFINKSQSGPFELSLNIYLLRRYYLNIKQMYWWVLLVTFYWNYELLQHFIFKQNFSIV